MKFTVVCNDQYGEVLFESDEDAPIRTVIVMAIRDSWSDCWGCEYDCFSCDRFPTGIDVYCRTKSGDFEMYRPDEMLSDTRVADCGVLYFSPKMHVCG